MKYCRRMTSKDLPRELSGKKLTVRCPPPEKFDEPIAQLLSDDQAMKYLQAMSKKDVGGWTLEDAKNRRLTHEGMFERKQGWFATLELNETGEFVGIAGLRDIDWFNRAGEMGIIISPEHWSKGYSGEAHYIIFKHAFEVLGLERIFFVTSSANTAMISFCRNVLKACHEGTSRNRFARSWTDSSAGYENTETFSVLSGEWPEVKARLEQKYDVV